MKVAVFGLGYVGTVTGAVLAAHGHDVWGVEVNPTKVATIAAGKSPIIEPGLDELLGAAVRSGSLTATTDAREALETAEASVVCVGTPSSSIGSTDTSYVDHVVGEVVGVFASGATTPTGHHALVIRSTVPPGTVDELISPRTGTVGGTVVGAGMCPEFLREGSAIADFYDAPLMVVGTTDPAVAETTRRLFGFLDCDVRVTTPRTAEALKLACNAFHATKISFANELGRLFRQLGVDSRAVMSLFCEDTKLNLSGSYLSPGFAFGGSCLPKDLRSLLHLARMSSIDLPLLAGAMATNDLCVGELVSRVLACDVKVVALIGLSFKMHVDDLRESPYVDVAETLLGKGLDVRIYDPVVDPSQLVGANRVYLSSKLPHVQRLLKPSASEALDGAELAVVASGHPSVVRALLDAPPRHIIDVSGQLGPGVERLDSYEGVAW